MILSATFVPFSNVFAAESILLLKKSAFKISPDLSLSFPQPIQVGFEFTRTPISRWRIFGETGIFSVPVRSSDRNFKMFSVQSGIRFFPKDHGLFSMVGFGFRQASFSTNTSAFKIDDEVLATEGRMKVSTFFIQVGVGMTFHLSERLIFGMDAGYQLALLGRASLFFSNSQTQQNSSSSELLTVRSNSLERIARLGIPQITLIRLSYLMD